LDSDYTKQNIAAIAEFFASGCKKEQYLGLELEHFIIDKQTNESLPYPQVEKVLKKLGPLYGQPVFSEGHMIGISREGAHITLEPAAQIEISIGPVDELADFIPIYEHFTGLLTPILDEIGCKLACFGYHPKSKIDDLPLLPKQRYRYMYQHFSQTGSRGKNMMKGSAATQVSVDYEDEQDFARKFLVANALGPLLAFIAANTSVFEGEAFGHSGMARTYIWNDVDPARSLVVPGALQPNFKFTDYASYLYNAPPILLGDSYTGNKTAAELFVNRPITRDEIEHIAGMVFPDVRLKTQLEIRMADSVPFPMALAYTALIQGIFYNPSNLDSLHNSLINCDVPSAKQALMQDGLNALVYGIPVMEWLEKLFNMANSPHLHPLKEKFNL